MTKKQSLAVRASAIRLHLWRSGGPYFNLAIREGVRRVFPPARARARQDGRAVRVVGLLSTVSGIGQSARLCVADLRSSDFQVSTQNLSKLFGVDGKVSFDAGCSGRPNGRELSIYHLNPPLMLLGMIASGPRRYYRGTNIAYWAWELPDLPPEWIVALDYVDAVLTPSTFCRDIIQRHTTKPVVVVPHPVPFAPGRAWKAHDEKRAFRVLSVFNCGSSLHRKNLFAVIEAFKLAFGNDRDAELVLKVADGRQHQSDIADLMERIGEAPNIRILDQNMTAEQLDGLMRSADAYISLHRSEGFGLTVAEAMMREVPVIVTGWSGTSDYCLPGLAHVVDFSLAPLDDPHPAYCHVREACWAEPSIEHAARLLAEVRADPLGAKQRAEELRRRLIAYIEGNRYGAALDRLCGPQATAA